MRITFKLNIVAFSKFIYFYVIVVASGTSENNTSLKELK